MDFGIAAGLGQFFPGLVGNYMQASSAEGINAAQLGYDQTKMREQNTFSADQAAIARSFSAGEATRQMEFQERMSSTAYQRAVLDMEKAGINPMVAYMQGGASSPAGASGSGTAASSGSGGSPSLNVPDYGQFLREGLPKSLATAMQATKLSKELESADADIAMKKASAETSKSQAVLNAATAKNVAAQSGAIAAEASSRKGKAEINDYLKNVDAVIDRLNKVIPFAPNVQHNP